VVVSEGGISKDTVEFFERSKNVNRMMRSGEEARALIDQHLDRIEKGMTGSTIFSGQPAGEIHRLDTRITILGHLLRGGAPSSADRVLATNLGTACVNLVNEDNTA
jgi:ATP-dependent phosphofructokinase / diphosphate-dependent phosphofructokinase